MSVASEETQRHPHNKQRKNFDIEKLGKIIFTAWKKEHAYFLRNLFVNCRKKRTLAMDHKPLINKLPFKTVKYIFFRF